MKIKRSTFNYIKDILADYNKTDEYIKQREEELRIPWREADDNKGFSGNYSDNDGKAVAMLITIEQDRRLTLLERNKRVIEDCMDNACEDTQVIIRELYMRKRPQYTLDGLIENNLIYCSRTQAYRKVNLFFAEVASELNLAI